jgi:hypothetical protein
VLKHLAFTRNTSFLVIGVALLAISAFGAMPPASAQDCQTALGSSSVTAVALTNGSTTTKTNGVDEWDGDILKLSTQRPGVLVIQGLGDGAQNSLYTEGSGSSHPLVDSAYVGTGLGELQVVIPAGDHCIQVAPGPNATGDFEIQATFTDACHLGETDDHGGSFLCATPMNVDAQDPTRGEITVLSSGSDYDMFTFALTSTTTVAIESSGDTDVAASLYDASGALLDWDDNSGTSPNFQIVRSLDAGQYYVRVQGVNDTGAYELSVSSVP